MVLRQVGSDAKGQAGRSGWACPGRPGRLPLGSDRSPEPSDGKGDRCSKPEAQRRGALSHALRRAPGPGDGKVVSAARCSPPDVETGVEMGFRCSSCWDRLLLQPWVTAQGSGTRPGDQHLASRGIITASL